MGEAGQGAGDSICTGGTQANAASESTGIAEAERLALVPAVMPLVKTPIAHLSCYLQALNLVFQRS